MNKRMPIKLISLLIPLLILLFGCSGNPQDSMGSDREQAVYDMATEETAELDEMADNEENGEITLDLGDKIIENA